MPLRSTNFPRLLFVAKSSLNFGPTLAEIKATGIDVTVALTTDSAVALSLGTHFAAVVLDASLIRNNDWTVARSLKLIRPSVPIVLIDSRNKGRRQSLPPDIDALASSDNSHDLVLTVKQLLPEKLLADRGIS